MSESYRGIRNNNYLNIKNNPRKPWEKSTGSDDRGHAIFPSPEWGLRAAILNLRAYWFSGLRTVEEIIERWAPADDTQGSSPGGKPNNPSEYARFVCDKAGFGLNQDLGLFLPDKALGKVKNLEQLIVAMAKFENAGFSFPRWFFTQALQLVQPGFADPNPASPPSGGQSATPKPPTEPAPSGTKVEGEDPLKELGEALRERLKKTTGYELIVHLLNAAKEDPAKPAPPQASASPAGGFVVNDRILRRLMSINAFSLDEARGIVFFGLRGCLPVSTSGSSFANSQVLRLVSLNYGNPRCTIGQWKLQEKTLAVFPGSTVPRLKYVEAAAQHNGAGTNQLMTGYYRFVKGIHRKDTPTGHRAFRQAGTWICRRTADNAIYDDTDPAVVNVDDDNLHAAFGDALDGPYSSAGCQVVMGFPKCPKFEDRPQWPIFRDNAYALDGQQEFRYFLLDALEVAEVSEDPDAKRPLLLRCGSHRSALPPTQTGLINDVQTRLKEAGFYGGEADGDFGAQSALAAVNYQKATFGATHADGIVGPETGMALLKNNQWINL